MVKLVNVYPNAPITTINPPIRTRMTNVNMSVEDIRKCLIATAYVEEILSGRRTIALDFSNYNKNNDESEIVSIRFVDAANHTSDPSTDSEIIVDTQHLNNVKIDEDPDKDTNSEVKVPEMVQPEQPAETPTQSGNSTETENVQPEQPAPVDEASAQSDNISVTVEAEDVEKQSAPADKVTAQSNDSSDSAVETEKKATVKNISRNNSKKAYVKPQNKK